MRAILSSALALAFLGCEGTTYSQALEAKEDFRPSPSAVTREQCPAPVPEGSPTYIECQQRLAGEEEREPNPMPVER
jgi:hypothetical protein